MTDPISDSPSTASLDRNALSKEDSDVLAPGAIFSNDTLIEAESEIMSQKDEALNILGGASAGVESRMKAEYRTSSSAGPYIPRPGNNEFQSTNLTALLTILGFEHIKESADISFADTLIEGELSAETFALDNLKAELQRTLRDEEIDLAVFSAYAQAIAVVVLVVSAVSSGLKGRKNLKQMDDNPELTSIKRAQKNLDIKPSSAVDPAPGTAKLQAKEIEIEVSAAKTGHESSSSLPGTSSPSATGAGSNNPNGIQGGGDKGTVTDDVAAAKPQTNKANSKKVASEEDYKTAKVESKSYVQSLERSKSAQVTNVTMSLQIMTSIIQNLTQATVSTAQSIKEHREAEIQGFKAELQALAKLLSGNSEDVLSLIENEDRAISRAIDSIQRIQKDDQTASSEMFRQVVF